MNNKETFSVPTDAKGQYIRTESLLKNFIKKDSEFPPEADRYLLYAADACPWCHRAVTVINLKGLSKVISIVVVDGNLNSNNGWAFKKDHPDPYGHGELVRGVYEESQPGYDGRVTVPILYDTKNKRIVSNESSDLIRMLNTEFNEFCETEEQRKLDLYPTELREKIDTINDWVYHTINNGVYKSGFAITQEAYELAVKALFEHLDKAEAILSKQRYLAGNRFTEADVRLFVTLIRFDAVYHYHFKCNLHRLTDYPNLHNYTKEIYQKKGIKETVDLNKFKYHYYVSHRQVNPYGIIPIGPILEFDHPHDRDRFPSEK
jgi:putative glutathione S-transferase